MAELTEGPPTYYANLVTSMINVDELTMEFRRVIEPHRNFLAASGTTTIEVPPVSAAKIAEVEPIARVILTFSAAKALKAYLDEVMPQIEHSRKTSEPLKLR